MKRSRFLPALGCISLVAGAVAGCGDEGAGTTTTPGPTAVTS
jgi:hypothetical protein